MSQYAIQVENLSKIYRIGLREQMHDTVAGAVLNFIKQPFANFKQLRKLTHFSLKDDNDIIWALKDISFNVKNGDVLGIVGSNGAGKSTLLKILSHITEPTLGQAIIHGRVSSLLEVGTGFHQELTGRENVYLNGAILGMTRREIDRKFDEIVAFAEVEKFIDTPVKRYSSGMRVRLAFAVAAHLEPEVLLIDEVLAVGDVSFQKKCLGKLGDVAKHGRTVLFVSHNMAAITNLCNIALWIDQGQLKMTGSPADVISTYLSSMITVRSKWVNDAEEDASSRIRIDSVELLNKNNEIASIVDFDKSFKVAVCYEIKQPTRHVAVFSRLTDAQGNVIWTSWDIDTNDWGLRVREPGKYKSLCHVPGNIFKPGQYTISVGALKPKGRFLCYYEHVLAFDISAVGFPLNLNRGGFTTPLLEWEIRRLSPENVSKEIFEYNQIES